MRKKETGCEIDKQIKKKKENGRKKGLKREKSFGKN